MRPAVHSAAEMRVELGDICLVVEHREPGADGGPTLRVRAADDDRELLRFDCFARGAHWHLDPPGRDEIQQIAEPPIEWTLEQLRSDLAGHVVRAGGKLGAGVDTHAVAHALDRVEGALRNPPAELDALDERRLRRRVGEKWQLFPADVLPLWVADMDFPVAEPVRRVVGHAFAESDLGYPVHPAPTDLPDVLAERMRERFGWEVEPRRIEILSDVVQGIYIALDQLSDPGDAAVIQTPIYPPFLAAVPQMGRRIVENRLVQRDGAYEVDLDGLRAAVDSGTRLVLLCNPHNPSGRAFRRAELEGIAEVALANDLLVVSDEIHADLVFPGNAHIPFASLAPEVEARTITLVAASKAFNIAGLRTAFAVFGHDDLKKRFNARPRHLRGGIGTLGIEATRAAYRHAQPWLDEVMAYLEANRDFVARFVRERLPGIAHVPPEATYLAWLDCRALEIAPSAFHFFLHTARVALSDGAAFGAAGEGFVRLNFATSRAILESALERMEEALQRR